MSMIKSYAAKEAAAELERFEYDAGELKPEDVEMQVDYCGISSNTISCQEEAMPTILKRSGFAQQAYDICLGHGDYSSDIQALHCASVIAITRPAEFYPQRVN